MKFIDTVFEKLARSPKRIVFPEGAEPRTLHAASEFARRKLGAAILLGHRDQIESVAAGRGHRPAPRQDRHHRPGHLRRTAHVLRTARTTRPLQGLRRRRLAPDHDQPELLRRDDDPVRPGRRPRRRRGRIFQRPAASAAANPQAAAGGAHGLRLHGHGTARPARGRRRRALFRRRRGDPRADRRTTRHHRRAHQRALLPPARRPGAHRAAELFDQGQQRLARGQARLRRRGARPAEGRERYMETHPGREIEIDGEMQADTAIDPVLAQRKAPAASSPGSANVLVFPDLNSGNIAQKLVQYLANARSYGQILLGLSQPGGGHVARRHGGEHPGRGGHRRACKPSNTTRSTRVSADSVRAYETPFFHPAGVARGLDRADRRRTFRRLRVRAQSPAQPSSTTSADIFDAIKKGADKLQKQAKDARRSSRTQGARSGRPSTSSIRSRSKRWKKSSRSGGNPPLTEAVTLEAGHDRQHPAVR